MSQSAGIHVVHISSVHPAGDPRIRWKQLRTITAKSGRGTLVTGDLTTELEDEVGSVEVRPGNTRRLRRILFTAPRAVFRALRLDADVYHFHDPELIPWAWLLLLKGRPVVYDIHEDYVTSIRQKSYLPDWLGRVLSTLVKALEEIGTARFTRVIAERYYRRRFPDAVPILNYASASLLELPPAFDPAPGRVLYTGTISFDRGALHLARLARAASDLEVRAIGRCRPETAAAMRREADGAVDRLDLTGEGRFVPFRDIVAEYRRGGWLAGLALFPDTEHNREKELTKFFEYMAVGLPIVASDFPTWRALIADQGVGLCVDPEDPAAAVDAIRWLRDHPEEGRAMGRRGRELVRERYNWEREGDRLMELYRSLADRQGRPPPAPAASPRDGRPRPPG